MPEINMDTVDEIGLAIVGCGTIGRIRAKYAREYPGIKWLGAFAMLMMIWVSNLQQIQ